MAANQGTVGNPHPLAPQGGSPAPAPGRAVGHPVSGAPDMHALGTVTATGTAPNTVTVSIIGAATQAAAVCRYLAGYVPTVNDTVLLAEWPTEAGAVDRCVLGKLA
jgi:hypothetical protein